MDLTAVDAHLLEFPLVEPFAASHGTTTARTLVAVRVEVDGVAGWGECSALPAATYTAESARGCYERLTGSILPDLVAEPRPAADLDPLRRRHPDAPMALAAVEMALLDAELRLAGWPLARHLGAERDRVPAGVSLGLDAPDGVAERAAALVAEGYRRLKVKIQPGHDREVLGRLLDDPTIAGAGPVPGPRHGDGGIGRVEVQLDANGAYGPDDLDLLVDLARSGAAALEQPLTPSEPAAAAELVARLADLAAGTDRPPVPVVADEAVTTLADLERLTDQRALTAVSIKPARVGGLLAAVAMHDRARRAGLRATAGGMLESGLGRHALVALAALPGFDLTGDLSPAGRWLAADAWPDLALADGTIAVPDGPGIAPPPDPEVLAANTIEHHRLLP